MKLDLTPNGAGAASGDISDLAPGASDDRRRELRRPILDVDDALCLAIVHIW